jgi:hypothetical protein
MFKKILINCFLVGWLAVLAIDAAPEISPGHKALKDRLDPFLDVTGLWQGGWGLFAPQPDKVNIRIHADVTFSDGREVAWHSPDWRSLSAWQRFLRFREAEFVDKVRLDEHVNIWPTFADYLCEQIPHPEKPSLKPTKIVLTQEWVKIPPPNPVNARKFPEVPAMENSFVFFAKEYHDE